MASVGDILYSPKMGKIGEFCFLTPVEDRASFRNCTSNSCKIKHTRFIKIYPSHYEPEKGEGGWPPFNTAVENYIVERSIALELAKRFKGLKLSEIIVDHKADKKEKIAEKYYELVYEIWVPPCLEYMPGATITRCEICGDENVHFVGVERDPIQVKIGDRWEWDEGVVRKPGEGILIPQHIIKNRDIMRCGPVLCTAKFKEYVESLNLPAVKFWEYGEVV